MHSVAAFLNVLPSLFSGGHRHHIASITLGQRCARRASSTNLRTKFRFAGVLTIGLVPFALMAQEQAPLKLVDTIALPELKDGDFDHFAADLKIAGSIRTKTALLAILLKTHLNPFA
jgi:hypothetical protein